MSIITSCLRHEWLPSHPLPFPLEKVQIFTFLNPIKNVRKQKRSALCHTARHQQSSSILCCCDLHCSKILIVLQTAFAASCAGNMEMKKNFKKKKKKEHTSAQQNLPFITLSVMTNTSSSESTTVCPSA